MESTTKETLDAAEVLQVSDGRELVAAIVVGEAAVSGRGGGGCDECGINNIGHIDTKNAFNLFSKSMFRVLVKLKLRIGRAICMYGIG
ncbi:hypothetical protein GOBAR_AA17281 [Gossypium barbadense]|uniref:Uncharacterized protein n=1 Tax=Gossypium barbadense TaxID=3634 RepID=A0A2P5XJC4_GOSBA|nr:hypothetical protein GOBAR_AA17281 [Gossypium barbadense]